MTVVQHLRSSATLAGPERHLLELAPPLARRGFAARALVLVRTRGRSPTHPLLASTADSPLAVEVLGEPGRLLAPAVRRRLADLPDGAILHAHDPRADAHALAGPRRRRVATVHLHTRSTLALRLARWVDLAQLRRFDAVILVTRELERGALARLVPAAIRHVVPNGIDAERWRARAAVELPSARADLDAALAGRAPRLLVSGRLTAQKGIDLALAALARLAERFASIGLAVAGEGPEREALVGRARELGVADRVAWLGFRADPAGLAAASDLVLLPSRREGLPYAALEAMALGRPLVASAVGGVGELVRDGIEGRLAPPGDAAALAAAIDATLENPAAAAALGERARGRVEREFDAESMGRRVAEIYDSL